MSRIIINNHSSVSDECTILSVASVMGGGRVSAHDSYCSITTWKSGYGILAQRTEKGTDTFLVFDHPAKK